MEGIKHTTQPVLLTTREPGERMTLAYFVRGLLGSKMLKSFVHNSDPYVQVCTVQYISVSNTHLYTHETLAK